MLSVRPSPLFKQNKFQVKTIFTTGEIVGLYEWIIGDICLVDPRGRPQSRPVVITIFTQSVRPSVSQSVPKLQNQAIITAGRDCELAEWIIYDICLVISIFLHADSKYTMPSNKSNKTPLMSFISYIDSTTNNTNYEKCGSSSIF